MDIATFLIEECKITNINAKDFWGKTAYDEAEKNHYNEMTEYLLIKGGVPGTTLNLNYKDHSIINILNKKSKYKNIGTDELLVQNDIKKIFFNNSIYNIHNM